MKEDKNREGNGHIKVAGHLRKEKRLRKTIIYKWWIPKE